MKTFFTWKKCSIYYALLWIFSITFISFPLSGNYGEIVFREETFNCGMENGGGSEKPTIIFSFATFYFPLIVMITIFFLVRTRVRKIMKETCQM